jgi:histidyl-tRNA synthetase
MDQGVCRYLLNDKENGGISIHIDEEEYTLRPSHTYPIARVLQKKVEL